MRGFSGFGNSPVKQKKKKTKEELEKEWEDSNKNNEGIIESLRAVKTGEDTKVLPTWKK